MGKGTSGRTRVTGGRAGGVLGVLVVALITALLVTSSPASSDPPVYGPAGTLDLFASAATGDGFDFTPTAGPPATGLESFSSNNKSKLSEDGPDDLVVLTPTGPTSGQLPYVGLKDHEVGVRSKGEGSGTPASRTDGDETLTIGLGPDVPGDYAWYAQIALSAKFDADVLVEALDGVGAVVDSDSFSCSLSDCGPDSGGDRILLTVGDSTSATLFTQLRISIENGGAAALIDDPSGTPGNDPTATLDTYFDIVKEFDGILACDENTGAPDGAGATDGVFTRLSTDAAIAAGCSVEKLFNFDVVVVDGTPQLEFEPNDPDTPAVYRGDIRLAASPANPIGADLEYDADGPIAPPAGRTFVPMQWCDIDPSPTDNITFPSGDLYYPELATLGTGGGPAFPVLPTTLDSDGEVATSCIVAFSSEGVNDDWVTHTEADPWYR